MINLSVIQNWSNDSLNYLNMNMEKQQAVLNTAYCSQGDQGFDDDGDYIQAAKQIDGMDGEKFFEFADEVQMNPTNRIYFMVALDSDGKPSRRRGGGPAGTK